MLGLQYFSFSDLWSPVFMVFMMAIGVLYTFVVGPWRTHFKNSEPVPLRRQIAFLIGVFLLYFAQGGPLSLLSHLMFSFHMLSMAISYYVVPTLFLYSIPAWLWRWAFDRALWRPFRFVMNPLLNLFTFNVVFSLYHIPAVHDWVMVNVNIHRAFYVLLFILAMMNWWHIHTPVKEWAKLRPLLRMGYIFCNGLLLTPACVLIIFAATPKFAIYNDPAVWAEAMRYCVSGDPASLLQKFDGGPAFFNLMTTVQDQQLGGILMKFMQEFINIGALFVIFMGWYRQERAKEDHPALDDAAGTA